MADCAILTNIVVKYWQKLQFFLKSDSKYYIIHFVTVTCFQIIRITDYENKKIKKENNYG